MHGISKKAVNKMPVRHLNLHEYQSKSLMAEYDIRVQKGEMATTVEQAYEIAKRLVKENAQELVLKAQIHAGGRGKGHFNTGFKGGVKVCTGADRAEQVRDLAAKMLGNKLITNQTGPEGQEVAKVLVHEGITFKKETYFAILMDRAYNGPVIVASPFGGVDIEETAHNNPNAIHKEPIDIKTGITQAQAEKIAKNLGFSGASHKDAAQQITKLYQMFLGTDSTQVEINPFVLASDGKVYCVDAKLNFDDNASFRQKRLFDMRDTSMEDTRDVEASKYNLNYIALDGNIGCMVNGAGLAMATMDIIKLHGGSPANFLDVGGGANEKQVEEAFKILTSDPKVKALLVNIFGGIMQCDIIAKGIINAAKNVKISIPLVVRLEGTNVDKGNKLLKDSGIAIITAQDLDQAAEKAVRAIGLKR
jgi:succinyl-CoA synthetase beta subunit